MKIEKYEKKKNGMYQVFFDNGNNIDLHEKIILKYNLLIKKQASSHEIDEMLDENRKYIAYDLALKYIGIKMRSKKEIKEYLLNKGFDYNTINEVIDILEEEKCIDDYNYSKAYVNDKILLSNDGPFKIRNKLNDLGVNELAINEGLEQFTDELQIERIKKIAQKNIDINRNKSSYALKNKIMDNLVTLGYSKSVVIEVINNMNFKDDSLIAKKEYEKIYKKLSKKYSGTELDYKVKQKMYSLGFNNIDD